MTSYAKPRFLDPGDKIRFVSPSSTPLRERVEDVPDLVRHFFGLVEKEGLPRKQIDSEAMDVMRRYRWPGNVRELENRVKRAVIMADGKLVSAADLDLASPVEEDDAADMINLKAVRDSADQRAIRRAIARTEGNISNAAKLLGISRPTLYDLIKQHGLVV